MKKLSIEEKAKRYDEVLERAKYYHDRDNIQFLENIFPELKDSEDERIRKALVRFHKSSIDIDGIKGEDILAWLERQGNADKASYEIAEKEKDDFVSGQFIECRKSFDEFKEDNSYWFEYVGNDTYIGRSDNILNKKFHITPRQLYCLFTQEHCPKENNVNEETNAPTGYGKYVDECLNEAAKHFFSEGEDKYSVADLFYAGVRCGKSWLEKQGKESITIDADPLASYDNVMISDKVEPKFKVGDWVVDKQGLCHQIERVIENVTNHTYGYDIVGGGYFNDNTEGVRLWTIQDAKDGDILAYVTDEEDLWIMIYRSLYEPYEGHVHYHALLVNDNFSDKGTCCICIDNLKPAIQEQRDTLMKAMADAGWEFDFEKKELKKIEQNPAWSEEDEQAIEDAETWLDTLCDYLKDSSSAYIPNVRVIISKLKSLKDRYIWKPSDEQIGALEEAMYQVGILTPLGSKINDLCEQLKKLKEK